MTRLTKKEKEMLFHNASKRMERLNINDPHMMDIIIPGVNSKSIYCNKCKTVVNVSRYKICPIHGYSHLTTKKREDGKDCKVHIHYEENADGTFSMYRIEYVFNPKHLRYEKSLRAYMAYDENGAFCLTEKKGTISKGKPSYIINNLPLYTSSNIYKILHNNAILKELRLIETLAPKQSVNTINPSQEIEDHLKHSYMTTYHNKLFSLIDLHKKDLANIKVLTDAGYSSIIDYLVKKNKISSIRRLLASKRSEIMSYINTDAEKLENVISKSLFLSQEIERYEDLSPTILNLIGKMYDLVDNKDLLMEIVNSPILSKSPEVYNSLYDLTQMGYNLNELWKYIRKVDLEDGIEPEEAICMLLEYYKISKINKGGFDFEIFPKRLSKEHRLIMRDYSDNAHYYQELLLRDNLNLIPDFSFSNGKFQAIKISDINLLKKANMYHYITGGSLTGNKLCANTLNFYLIKCNDKTDNIVGIATISSTNELVSILTPRGSVSFNDITRFIGAWVKDFKLHKVN